MYASHFNRDSTTSPISKLPVELLSEIFTLCALPAGQPSSTVEDEECYLPVINSETVRAPFILSRVNRRWRDIVLSQSSLWASLCITAELIQDSDCTFTGASQKLSSLNTSHITSCLQRSRRAPLNILIDVRDPEWNFSETGVGLDDADSPPIPTLFSSDNMAIVMSLLVPHLSRWRHLTILTDTWVSMHTALSAINPAITSLGAPCLESLTLMRCNDFVSFSPQFQPQDLKGPTFMSRFGPEASSQDFGILPKLKQLSLRGVHVDWDSLAAAMRASTVGLTSLELASHCSDVRPSNDQFHAILQSVPTLRRLVITGSGPESPEDLEDAPLDHDPVPLHHLQNVTIGYRTALEGRTVLQLLDAPNVKSLTLEDATYPGDPEEINGGSLLAYVGCRKFKGNDSDFRVEYPPPLVAVDTGSKQNSCIHRRKSSAVPSCEESNAAFPLLENVTLKCVKSSPWPLRTFFNALPRLQHLELIGMSMQAVQALVPCAPGSLPTCPCPQLRSLCIRNSEQLQVRDLDFIIGNLGAERQSKGACGLREVDIHVDAARAACVAASPGSPGTRVNIYSDDEDDSDDDEDYMSEEDAMDIDPFSPGGAFNDPIFDQYYSTQAISH
ncbi:hypothetical protein CVT25_006370 [Psilocybe cyanescens]|uniref:Uncharacterized protein n=1 Tax=Psilocybe cyanescens TaxID=93625 RepID=A0A409VUW5_PSICY|nr:hypothetical protein CVT25_006370 [Psilocybe cyanescens]